MKKTNLHPLIINQSLVLISCSLLENFNEEQLSIIGAYLTTLGDMISLNSTYCSYLKEQSLQNNLQEDHYDLLEKSINKIKEEIEKMKKT